MMIDKSRRLGTVFTKMRWDLLMTLVEKLVQGVQPEGTKGPAMGDACL